MRLWQRRAAVLLAAAAGGVLFARPLLGAEAAAPTTPGVKIDGAYADWRNLWLPPDISQHGHNIDGLIYFLHGFMGVLFVGWGVFFVYCLFRFRQRAGQRADYNLVKAKPSKYAEIAVAIIEAVLLLGFSVPIWASVKNDLPTEAQNPLRVRVLAEQFAWNFHYPGKDGKFGRTAPQFVNTASNPVGLDRSDANAKDDIVSGEMHLPVDRPVICDISSKDVIHSFAVPVLRVKQDAIPGMRIPVWFQATKTGSYEIACAQLCGNNHYSMRAVMVVEPKDRFDHWLEEKSKPPEEFEEE
ncbi:MAG: hypothetical protein HY763_17010 [Planctomycetes bacterium]|nr:hypothetical protein [Planctomycetota bacterium]